MLHDIDQMQQLQLQHHMKTEEALVAPLLVTQKIEESLQAFLQYNNNDNSNSTGTTKSSLVRSDGPLARRLLDVALQHADLPNERLLPRLFSLTCQVMVGSGHDHSIRQAYDLLWKLLNGHDTYFLRSSGRGGGRGGGNNQVLLYNTHHVNDACAAYIRYQVLTANQNRGQKIDHKTAQRIHRLIQKLEELYTDSNVALVADANVYDVVILFLCNQHRPREAYDRLQWMVTATENEKEEEKANTRGKGSASTLSLLLAPPITSFTTVISGFAKTGEADMAHEVIQKMLTGNATKRNVPAPNHACFNALLHAYAVAGGKDAGSKAEQTLQWMEQLHETQGLDTQPDELSYNTVVDAWAKSKAPDAPERAESLLLKMQTAHEAGILGAPSEQTFTSVMNAWATSRRRDATARVTALLDLLEAVSEGTTELVIHKPNIAYSILIKTWEEAARYGSPKQRRHCADEVLAVLERMKVKGITPSPGTYNAVLTALLQCSPLDSILFFLQLEEEYRSGSIRLDTRTFNCGLNAIAAMNKPDAMERATEVLKRMLWYSDDAICKGDKSLLPSRMTYNIILKVLSRSPSPHAAEKADALLSEMNVRTDLSPDFISFLTTILAWGRSEREDKFERVTDVLHRFIALLNQQARGASKSDVATFNTVLSVCNHNSNPDLRGACLSAVHSTMTALRKVRGLQPDEITYANFFCVVGGDSSEGGSSLGLSLEKLIKDEFDACVGDGLVTREILHNLQKASKDIWTQVMPGDQDPETMPIPKTWSRNVKLTVVGKTKNTGR